MNRRAIHDWQAKVRPLDQEQHALVKSLKKDGIATTTLERLLSETPWQNLLRAESERLRPNAFQQEKKNFLKEFWEPFPTLNLDVPFTRFALNERILGVVNGYLGMLTKLFYTVLNETIPMPQQAEAEYSQRWHIDPDNRQMCKVFLYLNDVGIDGGPFEYVRGSHVLGPYAKYWPQRPPHGNYPPKDAVEHTIPSGEILTNTGPAGTIVFCDTAGLHRGGYSKTSSRLMFTAGYVTNANQSGILYRLPDVLDKTSIASPTIRFAISGGKLAK
jgi:hypothetical protein